MNTPITRIGGQLPIPQVPSVGREKTEPGASFEETLKGFVSEVNDLQNRADDLKVKLESGEITDVHNVMIAAEEAGTAMELMLEIRNKIVDAYQEIMRMPV